MAKRVFIDSNIFLNFLLREEDFYEGAKSLPNAILISTARDFSDVFVSRDAELKRKASGFIAVVEPEELFRTFDI